MALEGGQSRSTKESWAGAKAQFGEGRVVSRYGILGILLGAGCPSSSKELITLLGFGVRHPSFLVVAQGFVAQAPQVNGQEPR